MNVISIPKNAETLMFTGLHTLAYIFGKKQKVPNPDIYWVWYSSQECWWPDLNRHGVAPEGF